MKISCYPNEYDKISEADNVVDFEIEIHPLATIQNFLFRMIQPLLTHPYRNIYLKRKLVRITDKNIHNEYCLEVDKYDISSIQFHEIINTIAKDLTKNLKFNDNELNQLELLRGEFK